jgi:exopolysaccharide production protein ExoZ
MESKKTILNLQIARFVAALMVLFSHVEHEALKPSLLDSSQSSPWDFIYFAGGVDIFFVISGFIMYHIAQNEFGTPGASFRFIVRRLLRVVAPYWICTTAMIIASIVFSHHVTHSELNLPHILASYFFMPFKNSYGAIYPVLMLGWTLNFEMLFYVLFAVALNFKKPAGPLVLAALISLIGFTGVFFNLPIGPFAFWCNPIVFEFLMGVGLAMVWAQGFRWAKSMSYLSVLLGFTAMFYLKEMGIAQHYWDARPLWMGLPALAICAAAVFTRESERPSSAKRALVFGGDISYALYLSHPFALNLLFLIYVSLGFSDVWPYIWTACIFSILGAIFFHWWIEKPVTAKLNQFFLPRLLHRSPQPKSSSTPEVYSQQLFSLQYLRAFAALLVVWQHAVFKMPSFLPATSLHTGAIGVAVFFVISGFVMQMTTDGKNVTPFEFLKRRIIRVAPLYWVITIVFSALLLARDPSVLMNDVSPMRIIKSLFFIPHVSPIQHDHIWPILIPGWTLNYEMFFYLIFAISMFFKARVVIVTIVLLSFVFFGKIFEPLANPLLITYSHPLFLEFLAGMLIYQVWKWRTTPMPLLFSILLIVFGLAFLFNQSSTTYFDTHRLLGAILLFYGSLNERFLNWENKLLLEVGNASYSIYLSHILTVPVVYNLLNPYLHLVNQTNTLFFVFMLSAIVISTLVGCLVYRIVELPMSNWLKSRFLMKVS